MNQQELFQLHETTCSKALETMRSKNHDYSGGGDPFSNFRGSEILGIHPVVGILLRMQDKIKRINTFATKGKLEVKNEGVNDAIEDIINYAILIKGMLNDNKPQGEKEKHDSAHNLQRAFETQGHGPRNELRDSKGYPTGFWDPY